MSTFNMDPSGPPSCPLVAVRRRTQTVDVVCTDVVLGRRLVPCEATLRQEELLHPGGVDIFGRNVPGFVLAGGAAASPDGRHVYASGSRRILVFERGGSP